MEPIARETWGKKILKARMERGLSREQLAKRAGIAIRTLYNLEHGKRTPHGNTLRKLNAALAKVPKLRF